MWKETGQSFEGTVEKIHPDGTCDVVYDALVQGSICRENHVSQDRITVINVMEQDDVYWNDSQQSTFPQDLQAASKTSSPSKSTAIDAAKVNKPLLSYSLENNPIVEKICKVRQGLACPFLLFEILL